MGRALVQTERHRPVARIAGNDLGVHGGQLPRALGLARRRAQLIIFFNRQFRVAHGLLHIADLLFQLLIFRLEVVKLGEVPEPFAQCTGHA